MDRACAARILRAKSVRVSRKGDSRAVRDRCPGPGWSVPLLDGGPNETSGHTRACSYAPDLRRRFAERGPGKGRSERRQSRDARDARPRRPGRQQGSSHADRRIPAGWRIDTSPSRRTRIRLRARGLDRHAGGWTRAGNLAGRGDLLREPAGRASHVKECERERTCEVSRLLRQGQRQAGYASALRKWSTQMTVQAWLEV